MQNQQIQYSEKYFDDNYEYRIFEQRHVIIPSDRAKLAPLNRLMNEAEWRGLGIHQSKGWVHYSIHKPEPHIILFRRPLEKK